MSTPRAIFLEAFAKITKGFTQGTFARNAKGHAVGSKTPTAETFCSLGAIYSIESWSGNAREVRRALEDQMRNVWMYNDSHSKEEVLREWKRVGIAKGWLDAKGCPILEEKDEA